MSLTMYKQHVGYTLYFNLMYKTQILYRIETITCHTPDVENPATIVAFDPFRVPLR